jgi:hypothetical protein
MACQGPLLFRRGCQRKIVRNGASKLEIATTRTVYENVEAAISSNIRRKSTNAASLRFTLGGLIRQCLLPELRFRRYPSTRSRSWSSNDPVGFGPLAARCRFRSRLMPLQRPHHRDPRQQHVTAAFGNQQQHLGGELPWRGLLLDLRRLCDVPRGLAKGAQRACPVLHRNRINEPPRPIRQCGRRCSGSLKHARNNIGITEAAVKPAGR